MMEFEMVSGGDGQENENENENGRGGGLGGEVGLEQDARAAAPEGGDLIAAQNGHLDGDGPGASSGSLLPVSVVLGGSGASEREAGAQTPSSAEFASPLATSPFGVSSGGAILSQGDPGLEEESIFWFVNFTSGRTKEAYGAAVRNFAQFIGAQGLQDIENARQSHVLAWREAMVSRGASARTVNARLSALSSLYKHLCEKQLVSRNPVDGVKRPKVTQGRVETSALSREQVHELLRLPDTSTLMGLRDEAILHTFFYTGCRLSELRGLKVRDFGEDQGFPCLDFLLKGGKRNRMAINPILNKKLRDFLKATTYGTKADEPIFQPLRGPSAGKGKRLSRENIPLIFSKYIAELGLSPSQYSPHSARATFITEALERNVPIEDVRSTVGHSHISTTQAYDKRAHKPERSASFGVRY